MSPLLAFLGVSALVIVTPGPDTALTVRNTLLGGRRAGMWTAAGVALGQAIWTLATSAGIAALLVASKPAFRAIQLAGAAYLVLLGVQALWGALRGAPRDPVPAAAPAATRLSPRTALLQGVLNNLGNPKMAVFFTSLLPQFAPAGNASFRRLLALGLVFCAMTLMWLAAYAAVVARAGRLLRRPGPRRVLEALTGTVLAALGVRLIAERR